MIDRQHGRFIISCDDCNEVLDTESDDFNEAINMAKGEGWTMRKTAGGWEHYCVQCSEEAA